MSTRKKMRFFAFARSTPALSSLADASLTFEFWTRYLSAQKFTQFAIEDARDISWARDTLLGENLTEWVRGGSKTRQKFEFEDRGTNAFSLLSYFSFSGLESWARVGLMKSRCPQKIKNFHRSNHHAAKLGVTGDNALSAYSKLRLHGRWSAINQSRSQKN